MRGRASGQAGRGPFLEDCLQQCGPVREEEVLRQHAQVLEECAPGAELVTQLAPQVAEAVEHAVESEGEQVDHHQQVGEAVGAVTEVVLEVGSPGWTGS